MTQRKKQSAGILAFRKTNKLPEVFLVHPGGPFWAKKDLGAWSIPKGEFNDDENPLDAAKREFIEETGIQPNWNNNAFRALQPIKMKSGKRVYTWVIEMDFDAANIVSNTFPLEWPPKSGKIIDVPEVDKGEWFDMEQAKKKINPAQTPLLEELDADISG